MSSVRVVGIDFDNTIVSYDEVMHATAVDSGLIDRAAVKSKKDIRDTIRGLPDGEQAWQRLQADVYGTRMAQAHLIEGVQDFVRACKERGIDVYIVSHKTEFAAADENKVNLREAALNWMRQNNFFEGSGLGLSPSHVFFESTRQDKIKRLGRLGCDYFIDDLEETFLEESFPNNVKKILYDPHAQSQSDERMKPCHSWNAIYEHIFKNNR